MKRALLAASAVVIAAGAGIGLVQVANSAAPAAAAGAPAKVDNFQLTDQSLMAHELYYFKYAPAIVVMSRTNNSAYSKAAAGELEKLAAAYKAKGVLFYMLDSSPADSREAIAAEHKLQGLTVPILVDEQQLVGEQLGVAREGEVYVIDPKTWKVAYHGALDARFSSASPKLTAQPGKAYAAE
ncbi:MAG TPA: redoxin domain-containing protein, partial [Caulobacteraceae bacterium]|nr:redoxin domain-containing protein [Caulobacteraceae bacterium]